MMSHISEDEHEKQVLSSLFEDEMSSMMTSEKTKFRNGNRWRRKRRSKTKKKSKKMEETGSCLEGTLSERNETTTNSNDAERMTNDNFQKEKTASSANPPVYIQKTKPDLKKESGTCNDKGNKKKYLTIQQSSLSLVDRKDIENRPATTISLTSPWARKFILSRPKDALLPVPIEFLSDGFNLVDISPVISEMHRQSETSKVILTQGSTMYKEALKLILEEDEEKFKSIQIPKEVQEAAEVIYHIVHARFVCSPRGLDMIRRMFKRNASSHFIDPIFGRCSRIACDGTPLLPFGVSNAYEINEIRSVNRKAMRYCCRCKEIFYCWDSKVDGSVWGPSFAFLFLMSHGRDVYRKLTPASSSFGQISTCLQPSIFGFPIHPCAEMNELN